MMRLSMTPKERRYTMQEPDMTAGIEGIDYGIVYGI
jgi:hypothetical protein